MAEKSSDYIYLECFKHKLTDTPLEETIVKPQKIIFTKWVKNARTIISEKSMAELSGKYGDAHLVLDFGREIVGKVNILAQAVSDTEVRLYYGEYIKEAMRTKEYESNWYRLPRDIIRFESGTREFSNQGRRAFRYLHIILPSGCGNITIKDISVISVHYPVKCRGSFSCSDARLNKIWDISQYTTKLCMQKFFEDGIKRDGMLWIGDYRIEFLCNAYCFGDMELARKSLYMIAETQREDGAIPACSGLSGGHQHPYNINYMPPIPEGVEDWVIFNYDSDFINSVYEYLSFTGDKVTALDLWPFVKRVAGFLKRSVDIKHFVVKYGPANVNTDCDHSTGEWWVSAGTFYMQLFWGFKDALKLADISGDKDFIKEYSEYLSTIQKESDIQFYRPEIGIYSDYSNLDKDKTGTSWHVNAFSAISGITDKERSRKALINVKNEAKAVYPVIGFQKYNVTSGLFLVGLTKDALDEIRDYWGFMVENDSTTCWDVCDRKRWDKYENDLAAFSKCHGWSAGPAIMLPKYVLGVEPIDAGFKTVKIEPSLGDLEWAEGSVPTPFGDVFVHWEAKPGFTGYIELPKGITGEAVLKENGSVRVVKLVCGENNIKAE